MNSLRIVNGLKVEKTLRHFFRYACFYYFLDLSFRSVSLVSEPVTQELLHSSL